MAKQLKWYSPLDTLNYCLYRKYETGRYPIKLLRVLDKYMGYLVQFEYEAVQNDIHVMECLFSNGIQVSIQLKGKIHFIMGKVSIRGKFSPHKVIERIISMNQAIMTIYSIIFCCKKYGELTHNIDPLSLRWTIHRKDTLLKKIRYLNSLKTQVLIDSMDN